MEQCDGFNASIPNLLEQFQEELNVLFRSKESWVATLPFPDVVGYDNDVDLFQFTERVHKLRRFETSASAKIRFDHEVYPFSNSGLKKLCREIKNTAKLNGTNLNLIESAGVLTCYRYHIAQKNSIKSNSMKKVAFYEDDGKEYDDYGVLCGIRNHSFHYNKKNNRVGGNKDIRGSHTYRPTSEVCKCGVRLTLKIHNAGKVDGFCYLLSGHGSRYHTNHPIPPVNIVSKSCKDLSDADIQLLNSTNNVTLPNTSMRRILMEHSNEYVTKSSARYIVDNTPDNLRAKKKKGTSSTGQDMVNWLQKEASEPNARL